jgi:hypothetical protein
MMFIRNRRVIAAIAATSCLTVTAPAQADQLPSTYKTDAAQADDDGTPYSPTGFKGGDSAQTEGTAATAFPPSGFRGGDTPVDHPGASRAQPVPSTVDVVRPERTIVREVDDALPLILSSTALLLVLAILAVALIRTRMAPRAGH